MTTSREIKSALTKAFKGVKFSVTTRNICCETIKIEWAGYPFINEVKAITDNWNTFEDHSDSMTDYFSYSGTKIEFTRNLSQDEIDFLSVGILDLHGKYIDGVEIEFNERHQSFREVGDNWYNSNLVHWHNKAIRDWKMNGLAVSLEESPQVIELNNEVDNIPLPEHETELIQGDYQDGMVNGVVKCIEVNWHEGIPVIEKGAKFATFKSFHQAVLKVCDINNDDFVNYQGCYTKLKFTMHYIDGSSEWGRLDLCLVEDNPYTTNNIIKSHWGSSVEFKQLEDVGNNFKTDNHAIASEWLIDDNQITHITEMSEADGVKPTELQKMFTESVELKTANDMGLVLTKYSQWVANKVATNQHSKIISFDDWLEIYTMA